jgi:hypothetical protein
VRAAWNQVIADQWLSGDATATGKAQNILGRMLLGSLSVSEASYALLEVKGGGAHNAQLIVLKLAEAGQGRRPPPPSGGIRS